MAGASRIRSGVAGVDDPLFVSALNHRIAEMRRLLDEMALGTTSEALRALRSAFPETSLDERVRAVVSLRH